MKLKVHWITYLEKVMPKKAHKVQVIETKKAFYAGMAAMMSEVMDADMNDEEGYINKLEAHLNELQEYFGEEIDKHK